MAIRHREQMRATHGLHHGPTARISREIAILRAFGELVDARLEAGAGASLFGLDVWRSPVIRS
jgi:hypothetical protein